ncbi:MAG: aminotransferase class I/II-fold pyridoxal phosphate-dependent enzyme [Flavobacteriaceae bacterium]|nr:aminotransferase class I/II-fold pyridoxal phosphate-dependent enzyme [Flavobacteriaceae bacterium]
MIHSFKDDYSEGCHPSILAQLCASNLVQTHEGNYGHDRFSKQARILIKQHLDHPDADIHFVAGGTQANLIVISSFLKPYEAVISAHTGHIAVHETGAIEAAGHKIINQTSSNGKLEFQQVQNILQIHQDEHMVKPRMLYISNATELGTVYSKSELHELYEFCQKNQLLLFADGARLANAVMAEKNPISLADLAKFTDVFYIGGTKNGALLGEAIVINNPELQPNFRYAIKQKGGLLAKSRLLGIQFLELFRDNLFFELGENANQQASQLSRGIAEKGYPFFIATESNQIFPILPKILISKLLQDFNFHIWQSFDGQHDVIRLVTSWATPSEAIDSFLNKI